MKTEFKEIQKFKQWWLWVILGAVALIPLYGLFQQIVVKQPFGNHPVSNWILVIFALFQIGLLVFFRRMTLITNINSSGIQMRFSPFLRKEISWADIQSLKIVNYGFVGYGIRFSRKYGTVYNTGGQFGLAIELKNRRKLVIGTQDIDGMKQSIDDMFHQKLKED